ncbi:MAG: hypothetical protein MZU97_12420 [Bacillus subtilis]|nr:hypothetical protein [Bacillus subtilis]
MRTGSPRASPSALRMVRAHHRGALRLLRRRGDHHPGDLRHPGRHP